jgi:glutamine---fructose-6-phosphate transaminase (isomerizing)
MSAFAYDTQLAAIPQTVAEVLARDDAPTLDPTRPVIFTGIGTSLHAARVAAEWVTQMTGQLGHAFAVDAHDLGAGAVPLTGIEQVIAISHRGYKTFPVASLEKAAEAGCTSVAVVGLEAPEQKATHVMRTCINETSGTFSVSYLATLASLARLVEPWDAGGAFTASLSALPRALAKTLSLPIDSTLVSDIADATPILISGFSQDLVTAQEAALKIKEGAWLWTEAMSPEFAIHGTPASYYKGMSAIVIMPSRPDGGRSDLLISVLRRLNLKRVVICGESTADLPFGAQPHPLLRPALAILPFHRLTSALAHLRGTDPDTLHGNREPWASVMAGLKL